MSEEQFALSRRNGLGASDSSIILGVLKFDHTESKLVQLKLTPTYTDEERTIAAKDSVRKGRDLEPLILQKFIDRTGIQLIKPKDMYRLKEFPYLTISFDGVAIVGGEATPVEAKYVTQFGDKYYDFGAAGGRQYPIDVLDFSTTSVEQHCNQASEQFGIPPYYYAQIQQQMLGLGSKFGFLAALRDKDWTLYSFWIPKDEWLQRQIVCEGYRVWRIIETRRNLQR
jgi:predicted phage-related endonuclease